MVNLILVMLGAVITTGGETQTKLDHFLQQAQATVNFNGSVLVSRDGQIIYQRAIGFADEHQKTPLTTKHQLSPGSIAKEFTTIAIMMLKEQGTLKYGDPISKYLNNLPAWSANITVEHIMTHTSGLGRIKFFPGITTKDVLKQIQATEKLNFDPGSSYAYGNLNVMLRALIIESITGKPFSVFAQEKLFKPAGMVHTWFPEPDTDVASLVWGTLPTFIEGVTFYTNPADLFRWQKAIWDGRFVPRSALKPALATAGKSGGSDRAYFDFGNFNLDKKGNLTRHFHDGSHSPHHAFMSNYLDKGVSIILISSDNRKSTLYEIEGMIKNHFAGGPAKTPLAWWLNNAISEKGALPAIESYPEAMASDTYLVDENTLNALSYQYAGERKPTEALAAARVNLACFPDSANAHDTYADMLIRAGKYDDAKGVIKKGLVLSKRDGNDMLTNSMKGYLAKIAAAGK